tara:strand:+ start:244 stop:765 length:522 start_codon:yes stop_codon:yes gene_type:complete
LNSNVSFDVVNETSLLDDLILSPHFQLCVFIFFNFEEKNITRTSSNESAIVDQNHLSQVHFSHSVIAVFGAIFTIDDESLTLSIETVDFLFVLIEEALVREVLLCANHYLLHFISNHALVLNVIDEMDVFQFSIRKQVDVNRFVGEESTCDEWVWERLVTHCVIVNSNQFVDV